MGQIAYLDRLGLPMLLLRKLREFLESRISQLLKRPRMSAMQGGRTLHILSFLIVDVWGF